MTDPNVETWLAELHAERAKFSRADDWQMRLLVRKLIACGEYREPVGSPHGDVWNAVQGYGAYWHRWQEPLECDKCKADLRDQEHGPPFKREVAHIMADRVASVRCPDCGHEWGWT